MAPRALGIAALAVYIVAAAAQDSEPQTVPPTKVSAQATTPVEKSEPTPDTAAAIANPDKADAGKSAPTAAPDPAVASAADLSSDDRNFSSSRETIVDISPPKDDLKDHPESAAAMENADAKEASTGVQELHQWNPMKALKSVEIGDFYFKRKNYRAALQRYKEALDYKEGDAVATFRLAQCQGQIGERDAALENYAAYLKILPHGQFADEARDAIVSLKAESKQ